MILSPSPHIHTTRTVRGTMLRVLVSLLPAWGVGIWFFGVPALSLTVACILASVLTEYVITRFMLRRPSTAGDCSALVTGLLLAMNLPPTLPLWMGVVGAVVAVGIAKMCFGGLGCNIFNPALVGRVFLLISFPVAMTTWLLPDGSTGPTILMQIKAGIVDPHTLPLDSMLVGRQGGSQGEISAIALIAGGLYLLIDRVIRWEVPVAILVAVALFDVIMGFPPLVDILGGGMLLGAFFMATDYSTSPMTRAGMLLYGACIGILTICIRRWGIYPEGMSFAILIMNAFTPLINIYMRPRRFSPRAAGEGVAR